MGAQNQQCSSKIHWALRSAIRVIIFGLVVTGAQSARAQNYNLLYAFTGGADGNLVYAPLVVDAAGNLYGTTEYGGTAQYGAVFKIDTSGNETVLYSFKPSGSGDGVLPFAGVVFDDAGNIYGTTQFGGAFQQGTVFKIDTSGNETVLYSFTGGADGAWPKAGLVRDAKGNLYGTTSIGGSTACGQGCGVVFKMDVQGNETVLYTFTGTGDGANPSDVILDKAGNLYGTTMDGEGNYGYGSIFKLNKSGKKTVLHQFTGGEDGAYPFAPLFLNGGDLYGTTQYGGAAYGVVFRVSTSGKKFTVLHKFTAGSDGAQPYGGVVVDALGNVYGTTFWGGTANYGTIFKVDKDGTESVLHSFAVGATPDGSHPYAGLVQDAAGNLYGTTIYGGGAFGAGYGTVFKLTP